MSEADDQGGSSVYQDRVLTHARNPVGYMDALAGAATITTSNPLCGDEVTVMGLWDPGSRLRLGFHCRSCLLCKASASIMVSSLMGRTKAEAQDLVRRFKEAFQGSSNTQASNFQGDLRAIFDLQRYPTRTSCVLLPWDAVSKLLYS